MQRLRREELLYGGRQLLRPSRTGGPAASCTGREPVAIGGGGGRAATANSGDTETGAVKWTCGGRAYGGCYYAER